MKHMTGCILALLTGLLGSSNLSLSQEFVYFPERTFRWTAKETSTLGFPTQEYDGHFQDPEHWDCSSCGFDFPFAALHRASIQGPEASDPIEVRFATTPQFAEENEYFLNELSAVNTRFLLSGKEVTVLGYRDPNDEEDRTRSFLDNVEIISGSMFIAADSMTARKLKVRSDVYLGAPDFTSIDEPARLHLEDVEVLSGILRLNASTTAEKLKVEAGATIEGGAFVEDFEISGTARGTWRAEKGKVTINSGAEFGSLTVTNDVTLDIPASNTTGFLVLEQRSFSQPLSLEKNGVLGGLTLDQGSTLATTGSLRAVVSLRNGSSGHISVPGSHLGSVSNNSHLAVTADAVIAREVTANNSSTLELRNGSFTSSGFFANLGASFNSQLLIANARVATGAMYADDDSVIRIDDSSISLSDARGPGDLEVTNYGSSGTTTILASNGSQIEAAFATVGGTDKGMGGSAKSLLHLKDSSLDARDFVSVGYPIFGEEPQLSEGELLLESSDADNDQAALVKSQYVDVLSTGRLKGEGRLEVMQLYNEGIVEPGANRSQERLAGWKSALAVDGDYFQSADGTIATELTPMHVLGPEFDRKTTAILANGTATLDGTLQITLEDGFTPDVGDRFAVLAAKSLEGRIENVMLPDISGSDDPFLALNYRREAGFFSDQPDMQIMEVVTLESPVDFYGNRVNGDNRPGQDGLVLLIHGTNSSADAFASLQFDLAVAASLAEGEPADLDIATFDWRDYAGGADDPFANISFGPLAFDPFISANNGINIGEALGEKLSDSGYSQVHVMGHSSGSWLADAVADVLDESGVAVHLTLFDAFVPPALGTHLEIWKQGEGVLSQDELGDSADYAEQYFDHGTFGAFLGYTQEILPNVVNINTSLLGGIRNPFASHAFPYVWYGETAQDTTLAIGEYGHPFSFSHPSRNTIAGFDGPNQPGNHILLLNDDLPLIVQINLEPISFATATHFVSGDVIIDDTGAFLSTNSPSILTSVVELEKAAQYVMFDFEFSGGEGLLSFYSGDDLVFQVDSSLFVLAEGLISTGWIPIPELDPGTHSLIFRLDNLTDDQSTLRIQDIRFSSLVAVPEPVSLSLVAMTLFCGVTCRSRASLRCVC